MVRRTSGEVALKWALQRRPAKTIKINGTEQYYTPQYQFALAMIWVKPEHLAQVLSIRDKECSCQNATPRSVFLPATLEDVAIWTSGSRSPKPDADYREEN